MQTSVQGICKRVLLDNIPLKLAIKKFTTNGGKRVLLDNIPLKLFFRTRLSNLCKRVLLDNIPLKPKIFYI